MMLQPVSHVANIYLHFYRTFNNQAWQMVEQHYLENDDYFTTSRSRDKHLCLYIYLCKVCYNQTWKNGKPASNDFIL